MSTDISRSVWSSTRPAQTRLIALGIVWSHGVLDAVTTLAAATVVGVGAESNPIIRSLLSQSPVIAVSAMLAGSGVAAALWSAGGRLGLPAWSLFGRALVTTGLLAAVLNVAVIVVALGGASA